MAGDMKIEMPWNMDLVVRGKHVTVRTRIGDRDVWTLYPEDIRLLEDSLRLARLAADDGD